MRWSIRIATAFGIGIYIHWTFWLLVAWVFYINLSIQNNVAVAVEAVGLILAIFACVVLHELGHALAARRYGIGTRDITLLPIGGIARLDRMPEQPAQELVVALAGPAVNVVIAGVLAVVLTVLGDWPKLENVEFANLGFLFKLMAVNVLLVAFNMIPAFPMDGGRVLRSLLAMQIPMVSATRIAAKVGQVCAVGFGLLGLWLAHPFLVLIAVFVFIAAQQEANAVEARSAVAGLRVRDATMRDFMVLAPTDTVAHAAKLLLSGSQTEFPIVAEGKPIGLLSRERMIEALADGKAQTPVTDWTIPECRIFSPQDSLRDALAVLVESRCRAAMVVEHDRVMGLLTLENIHELMMVRSAMATPHSSGPRRSARVV